MMLLIGAVAGFSLGLLTVMFGRWVWTRRQPDTVSSADEIRFMGRKLAHEIRNPLNTMNLHVQLLEEELQALPSPPENAQKRLQKLQQEIQRLDRILTDYQRYARLPEPEFRECDLNQLLTDLLDFIEPEIQHRGITLVRDIAALPSIQVDANQIRQVLLNLLLNAYQAMPEGGTLRVRAYPAGEYIRIDIQDTGVGIPEDQREKIFEPFYSTKEEGTGIGLPMVKYIVEKHGGQILLASQVGQGSTFSVLLPRKQSPGKQK